MSDTAAFRIRSWHIIVSLASFCVILGAIGAFKWFTSAQDLAEIDAKAASLHVPCTWADAGLHRSPEPAVREWRELLNLSTALTSYQDAKPGFTWKDSQPGIPLEQAFLSHHAQLPPAALDEVLQRSDRVKPDSVELYEEYSITTILPEIEAQRRLTRLLTERLMLATPDTVAPEARRCLAVICAQPARIQIQYFVAASGISYWRQAVSRHLREPGLPISELADLAAQARSWLETAFVNGLRGEFIAARSFVIDVQRGDPRFARGLGPQLGLPDWLDGFGLERPLTRHQRGPLLSAILDQTACWQSATDAAGRRPAFLDLQKRLDGPHGSPPLAGLLLQDVLLSFHSWVKNDASLRVLEAELRGNMWPPDPTDPAGGPIRRIERGGRLIGFCLLGKNGVYDGMRPYKDDCIGLYEPLGTERASDPWIPPPPPVPPSGTYIYGAQ